MKHDCKVLEVGSPELLRLHDLIALEAAELRGPEVSAECEENSEGHLSLAPK